MKLEIAPNLHLQISANLDSLQFGSYCTADEQDTLRRKMSSYLSSLKRRKTLKIMKDEKQQTHPMNNFRLQTSFLLHTQNWQLLHTHELLCLLGSSISEMAELRHRQEPQQKKRSAPYNGQNHQITSYTHTHTRNDPPRGKMEHVNSITERYLRIICQVTRFMQSLQAMQASSLPWHLSSCGNLHRERDLPKAWIQVRKMGLN